MNQTVDPTESVTLFYASRAKYVRDMGWNAALSDERLKALQDSRQLYVSALKHLLGDGAVEGREAPTTPGVPRSSSQTG